MQQRPSRRAASDADRCCQQSVDANTANADKIPAGALKFYWARHTAEREACQADPDCPFDSSIKDGSFAHLTFRSKEEAEVELISHRESQTQ